MKPLRIGILLTAFALVLLAVLHFVTSEKFFRDLHKSRPVAELYVQTKECAIAQLPTASVERRIEAFRICRPGRPLPKNLLEARKKDIAYSQRKG